MFDTFCISVLGHVTGSCVGGTFSLSLINLAKLNPNCHMNYSFIFKEISFYLETLSFTPKRT